MKSMTIDKKFEIPLGQLTIQNLYLMFIDL